MRTKIQTREYCNWPGSIRRRLMALTLREWSGMRLAIRANNDLITFVLFEQDQPVAWSLVEWDQRDKKYNIMLYVRRNKWRRGYGRRLFTKAKKWVEDRQKQYCIFPDPYNEQFFKQIGEKV